VFERVKTFGAGFRTLVASAALFAVGVADAVGSIDLTPMFKLVFKDGDAVGLALCVAAIAFGFLRYLSTGPVGQAPPPEPAVAPQVAPVKSGVDAGA
jgi:hypothetical protein